MYSTGDSFTVDDKEHEMPPMHFTIENQAKKFLNFLNNKEQENKNKEQENKKLEKELSQIKETFQCTITQNYTEDNKDEIHIKDSYTEIHIKNGRLCLKIYPPNTEPYDFYYRVAGTLITHEKFSTKNKLTQKYWQHYLPEHMPIISKKTEKSCHRCTHHDYDEFNRGDGNYDEYEVCRKNHDLSKGPCEDYEEL